MESCMNLDIKKYEPIFGEWIVDKCLGTGSVGNVYKIVRENFGIKHTSALKVISIPQDAGDIQNLKDDGLEDQDIREYYKSLVEETTKEIKTMLEFKDDSNIVSYEEYKVIPHADEIGWDILVRMELLTPLPEYYRKNNITEYAVVKMGIEICQALSVYHKAGIIHKAIKPENIFVSPVGEFKLGDFGVAYKAGKEIGMLSSKGTQWYMAPEVCRQDIYNSSAETYSLSLVLYRLLNHNRFPFLPEYPKGISHEDRNRAFEMKMKGAVFQNPANASEKIAHIIKKGCEFHPQKRYSTTERMQKELEKALVDTDNKTLLLYQEKMNISAEDVNPSQTEPIANQDVKPKKLVYILVAVIILLLVLICLMLWKIRAGNFSSKEDAVEEYRTEVLSTQEVIETETVPIVETETPDINQIQEAPKDTEIVETIPEEEVMDEDIESNVETPPAQPAPQQEPVNNQPPQQPPAQEQPVQQPVQQPPQQPPVVNEEEILFDNSISEDQLFE